MRNLAAATRADTSVNSPRSSCRADAAQKKYGNIDLTSRNCDEIHTSGVRLGLFGCGRERALHGGPPQSQNTQKLSVRETGKSKPRRHSSLDFHPPSPHHLTRPRPAARLGPSCDKSAPPSQKAGHPSWPLPGDLH